MSISASSSLRDVATVGFGRSGDRYLHPDISFWVEFPRGPLGVGADIEIQPAAIRIGRKTLLSLSATDSCRDRLAAFYFWGDRKALEAAVQISESQDVNLDIVRRWSQQEGHGERYQEFLRERGLARKRRKRNS